MTLQRPVCLGYKDTRLVTLKTTARRVLKVYKWYLSVAHFLFFLVKDFQYKKRRMLTRYKYTFREIADSRYTISPASADTIGAVPQGMNSFIYWTLAVYLSQLIWYFMNNINSKDTFWHFCLLFSSWQ